MKRALSAVLALLATASGLSAQAVQAAAEPAAATVVVGGVVIDESTWQPVAGVAVYIAGDTLGTLTDAEGRYVIEGVPRRNHIVSIQRLGYLPERRLLMVCAPPQSSQPCTPAGPRWHLLNFYLRAAPDAQRR